MKRRALLTESLNMKAFYSKEATRLEGCELGNIVYNVRSSKTRAHLSSENLPCFVSSTKFGVQKFYAISIGDSYHVLTSFQGMLMLHVLNYSMTTELCQQGDILSSPDLGSFACNAQRMVLVTRTMPPLSRLGSMFVLLAGRMLTADCTWDFLQTS